MYVKKNITLNTLSLKQFNGSSRINDGRIIYYNKHYT